MTSIEQWTEENHAALLERVTDPGASKTPTEFAAARRIAELETIIAQLRHDLTQERMRSDSFRYLAERK